MRIALVPPLYESVPPRLYGGTERVVAYLADELVRLRHDVTLFASGDSVTSAKLVPCGERATRLDLDCIDDVAPHLLQLERVIERAAEFDVIHFHHPYLHFMATPRIATAHVTTMHNRLDRPHLLELFGAYCDRPMISISKAQRAALPHASWCGTVYHGLPLDLHHRVEEPADYFAFLGRVSPEKGIERAIQIALRLGVKLKIAAKIDKAEEQYHRDVIVPLLDHPLIEFLGEIPESSKTEFLGNARALLFPIDWPEPFGLVVIEAMACGTPIVGYGNGSVPELIDEGVSGYVVNDFEAAVAAAARVHRIDRRRCRAAFERRFSSERMARDYVTVYRGLIDSRRNPRRGTRQAVA